MREAVSDVSELSFLDVLLDGVERFLLADLFCLCTVSERRITVHSMARTCLHLGIGPARDLDDHVEDRLLLVGVEGDVVEWRNGNAILFDVDAVLKGVRGSDLPRRVVGGSGSHCCWW